MDKDKHKDKGSGNPVNPNFHKFCKACDDLQLELERFGINITAISGKSFLKASRGGIDLFAVTERIKNEVLRLSTVFVDAGSKENEVKHLWNFLKEHKFRFSEDLFLQVQNGYFLEIYNDESKAIYRSPNFYRETSYSIADLNIYTWVELFDRADKYSEALQRLLVEVFKSPVGATYPVGIEPHSCMEIFSSKQLTGTAHPLFFSAVESDAAGKCVVTANKITNITPKADLLSGFKDEKI